MQIEGDRLAYIEEILKEISTLRQSCRKRSLFTAACS